MGRKKLYPKRITLPLTAEALDGVDRLRGKQARVGFIRAAINREIRRRSKPKSKGRP